MTAMTAATPTSSRPMIKAYACSRCDKSYHRRDYLQRHEMNHEQPTITCPTCEATFTRADVLKRHIVRYCPGIAGSSSSTPQKRKRKATPTSASPSAASSSESSKSSTVPDRSSKSVDLTTANQTADVLLAQLPSPPPSLTIPITTEPSVLEAQLLSSLAADSTDSIPVSRQPTGISPISGPFDGLAALVPDNNEQLGDLFDWLCAAGPVSTAGGLDMGRTSISPNNHSRSFVALPTQPFPAPPMTPDLSFLLASTTPGTSSSVMQPDPLAQPTPSGSKEATAGRTPFWDDWLGATHHSAPDPPSPPRASPITPEVRERILNLLGPGLRTVLERAFGLTEMKRCLELYFIHGTPMYPIIHLPSLPYRQLADHLLLMLIILGSSYSDDSVAFEAAVACTRPLRNFVFERIEQQVQVPVADLQTLLLLDHFCRTYCRLNVHDSAQIYHSPVISIAQMAGVFMPPIPAPPIDRQQDPMGAWLQWVVEEERIRVGWHAFVLDSQNAVMYRQSFQLHCIAIDIPLPADERIWEATDKDAWCEEMAVVRHALTFRHALRDLIERGTIDQEPNEQSLFILLHGLFAVSLTLRWRDLERVSMLSEAKIKRWKATFRHSFNVWMDHVERVLRAASYESRSVLQMPVFWAGLTFAHLGTISFVTDTTQLRIAAGAWSVGGRLIAPQERQTAEAYIQSWGRTEDAGHAFAAAIHLLAHLLPRSEGEPFRIASNFVSWGAYIASIVIWSYARSSEGPGIYHENPIISSASVSLPDTSATLKIEPLIALRDAYRYLDRMTRLDSAASMAKEQGKNKCAGLLAYTASLAGRMKRGRMEEIHGVLSGVLMRHLVTS